MTENSITHKELSESTKFLQLKEILAQLILERGCQADALRIISEFSINAHNYVSHPPIIAAAKLKKISKEFDQEYVVKKYKQASEPYGELQIRVDLINQGELFIKFPITALTSDEVFDLVHKPGEIWLLDFWATWCGPCQPVMAHNQEILDRHPEWKGKVRIMGISIDKSKDLLIQRIEEKKWTSIEHYVSPGVWQGVGLQLYGIKGIPFIVLIDAKGQFAQVGNIENIEESINLLIKGEKIPPQSYKIPEDYTTAEIGAAEASKIVELAFLKHQAIFEKYNLKIEANYIYDMIDNRESSFIILNSWNIFNKKKQGEIHKELDILTNDIKVLGNIKRNLNFGEYFEVRAAKDCSKCKIMLGNAEHLRCRECEYALCYECSLTDKHEHNMYYLKKDADTEVIYGPGPNKTGKGDDSTLHKNAHCMFCDGPIAGIRWKCMKCAFFDICEKCFEMTRSGNKEKNKYLYDKVRHWHNIDNHVLLRIIRNDSFIQ